MPSVLYGGGSYERLNGNFPPLQLINMYVEQAKTSEGGVALLSRPGLGLLATVTFGAVVGMFSKRGTFGGDVFSVAGSNLHRGTSNLGSVLGSGFRRFAGSDTELVIAGGGAAQSYNGTNLASISFPDTANVVSVCFIGSLFIYIRASSGRFYWSSLLDGRTVNALDYATAEREPDYLLDVLPLGDNIWLFGQQTVEAWAHTGDADLPFTRLENVAFDKGIMETGACVRADNSIIFVGSDRSVYRVSDVPERISDHSIEERIIASATCSCFTFKREGHEFVAFRLASETLIYDCATREWCEFQSSGGQWIAQSGCMVDKVAYFGRSAAGELMGWDEWDDMGSAMERRFSFAQQLDTPMSVNSIKLWCNPGQSPGSSTVSLRTSRDAGQTWSDWEATTMGASLDYRTVPEWRALGMFDFPGLLGEVKTEGGIPFRISAVKLNDPNGGRSRNV